MSGILGAFGAAKQQSRENIAASEAEETRQADIRSSREFAREDPSTPELKKLRADVSNFLSLKLGQDQQFSPGFFAGKDLITRGAENQRVSARGESGVPAGLFAKSLGNINRGEQQSLAQLGVGEQQNQIDQANQLITQILQLLGIGSPTRQFATPSSPIVPTIGPGPIQAGGQASLFETQGVKNVAQAFGSIKGGGSSAGSQLG